MSSAKPQNEITIAQNKTIIVGCQGGKFIRQTACNGPAPVLHSLDAACPAAAQSRHIYSGTLHHLCLTRQEPDALSARPQERSRPCARRRASHPGIWGRRWPTCPLHVLRSRHRRQPRRCRRRRRRRRCRLRPSGGLIGHDRRRAEVVGTVLDGGEGNEAEGHRRRRGGRPGGVRASNKRRQRRGGRLQSSRRRRSSAHGKCSGANDRLVRAVGSQRHCPSRLHYGRGP